MEYPSSLPESADPGNDPGPGHFHLSAITACPPQSLLAALRSVGAQRHHGGKVFKFEILTNT